MKKIALITGATSGIGKATASLLASNNFDLILTGRRQDRLQHLRNDIEKTTTSKVLILHFDIRSMKETENAVNNLPETWKNIDVLINNAGLAAGLSQINNGNIDD